MSDKHPEPHRSFPLSNWSHTSQPPGWTVRCYHYVVWPLLCLKELGVTAVAVGCAGETEKAETFCPISLISFFSSLISPESPTLILSADDLEIYSHKDPIFPTSFCSQYLPLLIHTYFPLVSEEAFLPLSKASTFTPALNSHLPFCRTLLHWLVSFTHTFSSSNLTGFLDLTNMLTFQLP